MQFEIVKLSCVHVCPPSVVSSSHGRRTPSSGTEWNGASPGWASSGTSFSAGNTAPASPGADALSLSCCFVCAERLPSRARSRWGKSREVGVRGTIGSTKLEHERLRAPPAYSWVNSFQWPSETTSTVPSFTFIAV
jgi:hypothetical protein